MSMSFTVAVTVITTTAANDLLGADDALTEGTHGALSQRADHGASERLQRRLHFSFRMSFEPTKAIAEKKLRQLSPCPPGGRSKSGIRT
jgi:hypothetical protein